MGMGVMGRGMGTLGASFVPSGMGTIPCCPRSTRGHVIMPDTWKCQPLLVCFAFLLYVRKSTLFRKTTMEFQSWPAH